MGGLLALTLTLNLALSLGVLPGAALAQDAGGAERPPTPVTVVTLAAQDVTLTTRLPGRVVASGVAEIRPQVTGIITERLFDEGSRVELGDPLYQIDADSYAAAVAAARAQVAEANARLRASSKEAERTKGLTNRGVVSEQNLETAISTRDVDAATLQVAQAQLQIAEINLERTTIRATLSGVIGRSLVSQGALVTTGQSEPLAVIRTLDPVYVDVTQSSAEILAWRRGNALSRLGEGDMTVSLILADGAPYEITGQMTAAEPFVNEATGVVTLRMEFANPDGLLLPGMYVQVEMPQGVARNVVLAPQEGVSRDRRGQPMAYVVTADDVIETRQLEIAQAMGPFWVVTGGLSDGDRLVVEGLQKIAPQAKVAATERAKPDAATPETAPVTN